MLEELKHTMLANGTTPIDRCPMVICLVGDGYCWTFLLENAS